MLHRTDENHTDIVEAFENLGCTVADLSAAGRKSIRNIGAPDLIVGIAGKNEFVEVKTEEGRVSLKQIKFNEKWRGGKPHIVRNVDDVINLVQKIRMSIKNGITRNVSNVE